MTHESQSWTKVSTHLSLEDHIAELMITTKDKILRTVDAILSVRERESKADSGQKKRVKQISLIVSSFAIIMLTLSLTKLTRNNTFKKSICTST